MTGMVGMRELRRQRRGDKDQRAATRKGMGVKVRLPGIKPFEVECRNTATARKLEQRIRESEDELRGMGVEKLRVWFRDTMMKIDAAQWQAEKRVRGSRQRQWGGGYG